MRSLARLAPLATLALLLATTGCESLAERSKHLTSASAFEWTNERFKIAGEAEMWGQVGVYEGKLSFFAKGFPPGTRFTIGTATATAGEDGDAQLETPAQSLYGVLPFGTVEMPTIEGAAMKVEAPGASALDVPLPPIRVPFVGSVLLEAAKGPVLFAGEDPSDAKLANIVFDATAQQPMVVGSAPKTLADVDAIAIMTLEPTGQTKECTGYVNEQGQAMPPVQLKLAHSTVAVHRRRTGEQLASKRFDPVEECPASFMKWSDEDPTSLRPYVPTGAIQAWLASVLAERSAR
jgi:hypothetical protein